MKSTITFAGALSRAALIALAVFVPAMALFSGASSTPKAAHAQRPPSVTAFPLAAPS